MAAFITFLIFLSHGAAGALKDPAIERSTTLIIQKKRSEALKVLEEAIKKSPPNSPHSKELEATYTVASEIFLSDRGQSLYEAGKNLYFFSSPETVKRLNEALAIEENNSLILWSLTKAHLSLGQCDQADIEFLKIPSRIRATYFRYEYLKDYCRMQDKSFEHLDKAGQLEPFEIQFFKGFDKQLKGRKKEALLFFENAQKLKPNFIETSYWIWKLDPKEVDEAVKYKKACETQKSSRMKEFEDFPQLCHFLPETIGIEGRNDH